MARAHYDECCEFRTMHQIKFQSLIQGHHVYKIIWSLYKGETLIAQLDNRDEAQENDKYTVGIYKKNNVNNKIVYNKLSNCMLFLDIFKFTDKIPMNVLY